MEQVCLFVCVLIPALNMSSCSGGGSKANIGWAFYETYQPIVETTVCSDHPQMPQVRASDKFPPPTPCAMHLTITETCYLLID